MFPPTPVLRDYLSAAALPSSDSLVYKRVKPYHAIQQPERDDTRQALRWRITAPLARGRPLYVQPGRIRLHTFMRSIPELILTVKLIPELIRVHIGGISGLPKLLFLITQAQ